MENMSLTNREKVSWAQAHDLRSNLDGVEVSSEQLTWHWERMTREERELCDISLLG